MSGALTSPTSACETLDVSGGHLGLVLRCVVNWQLDQTLDIDFVLVSVDTALAQAKPLVWNSDQGSHLPHQYTQRLLTAGVQISMDGKGRALDNIL
jgi:putative transposase